jgi:hypothetical protein
MGKIGKFACVAGAAVLASSVGVALLSGGVASAGGPKPPVTVTCTSSNAGGVGSLFGTTSNQLEVGCVGSSSKAKITPTASVVPDVSNSTAVVYWTNNKTTDESFSYAAGGTCPTFLGVSASAAVTVTATETGGNAGLTKGQVTTAVNCLYSSGGNSYVQSAGPVSI